MPLFSALRYHGSTSSIFNVPPWLLRYHLRALNKSKTHTHTHTHTQFCCHHTFHHPPSSLPSCSGHGSASGSGKTTSCRQDDTAASASAAIKQASGRANAGNPWLTIPTGSGALSAASSAAALAASSLRSREVASSAGVTARDEPRDLLPRLDARESSDRSASAARSASSASCGPASALSASTIGR